MSYRTGEASARIAELEQELSAFKERERQLERKLWAERKRLRPGAALGFASALGIGALVGIALGGSGWVGTENPNWLWVGALVGALFGGIGRTIWQQPDRFPPPPVDDPTNGLPPLG